MERLEPFFDRRQRYWTARLSYVFKDWLRGIKGLCRLSQSCQAGWSLYKSREGCRMFLWGLDFGRIIKAVRKLGKTWSALKASSASSMSTRSRKAWFRRGGHQLREREKGHSWIIWRRRKCRARTCLVVDWDHQRRRDGLSLHTSNSKKRDDFLVRPQDQ